MDPFRLAVACALPSLLLMVGGCATRTPVQAPATLPPVRQLPLAVGNGAGSQYGNYAAQMDGEMRGPAGERCVVFNWDRPLTAELALRLRSASCESKERPGWMVAIELERTVIPLSESNLAEEALSPQ